MASIKLFVGGIPHDASSNEIDETFLKYGCKKIESRISQGFIFLTFATHEDAEEALEKLKGVKVGGRQVNIEFAKQNTDKGRRVRPPERGNYRVEVSRLPRGTSWQDLKDHFRRCGPIAYADVDKQSNIGFIDFKSRSDYKYALDKMHKTELRAHSGERSKISCDAYKSRGRSRSRSRSYSRSRSSSRSRKSRGSRRYSESRSRSRSGEKRGRSRSPDAEKKEEEGERAKSESRSPSRSKSPADKNSNSRSPSRSGSRSDN